MTRLPSLAAFPPQARERIKASPQYRALEAAERARQPRPELRGYDSMPERLFADVLEQRRLARQILAWSYHAVVFVTPGGNRYTPDFLVNAWVHGEKPVEIKPCPTPAEGWMHGAIVYEVQAAPWRLKSGRLAQHHSKRAQRVVLKEIRAAFPWLRIVIAEHQRGGGFREKQLA